VDFKCGVLFEVRQEKGFHHFHYNEPGISLEKRKKLHGGHG
jgi:hypothetical protein